MKTGFTLIELLIVIGIISTLMGIVTVAVNPMRQFAMANNTRRWTNVVTILNAVYQNIVDNEGSWCPGASSLPTSTTFISSEGTGWDFCNCLVPIYIAELPYDPLGGLYYNDCTDYDTGYTIFQDPSTNRITIAAPNAQSENGVPPEIAVTR